MALLTALYGSDVARPLATTLAGRCEQHRAAHPAPAATRQPLPLTQADALLIAYADHVQAPDEAPLRTLADFAQRHLRGVVSGIHLLPFYPSSSDDGFAVKDFFAVAPEYGTWDDIAHLRATGFDLMFDGVFNHASAQGDWFRQFLADAPAYRDFFVTVEGKPDLSAVIRPRALPLLTEFATAAGPRQVWTTFSADQVDLNFREPAVLLAVVEAMLCYAARGARFLRLDAIAFLWKEIGTSCLHRPQTHVIIRLLRAVLDAAAPHVLLITETNVPHRDNVSYFGHGADEAQLVYNFALPPLVLHSFQTGSAAALTRWAQSLEVPSNATTFFNFLASHDGIGLNPARGLLTDAEIDALVQRTKERGGFVSYKRLPDGTEAPYELNINLLDALAPPAVTEPVALVARRFLTAHAILLSLAGVPGIYFHSLFGSHGDPAAVTTTNNNRRINREKLIGARLEAQLTDATSLRAQVFAGMRAWLERRRVSAAFAPSATQQVRTLDPRVFTVLREDVAQKERVLCLHNVSADIVPVPLPRWAGEPLHLQPWETRWLATPPVRS
ncbi:MAG: sugar phosphorylase [Opitutae bacterium]|nr:sugar phosphorylase [Opitutae bacterium]